MISPVLKDFIEHNSNLLETDLRAFLGKALVRLRGTVFEELIFMLKNADIDISDHRDRMLINKLGFIFPVVEDKTPLFDMIHERLMSRGARTFFGMTPFEIFEFICKHEAEWKDDMWLEEDTPGTTIVRTKE